MQESMKKSGRLGAFGTVTLIILNKEMRDIMKLSFKVSQGFWHNDK